ncbi:MAG: methylthioribulose 1-phosphate dehydratase [Okeania sp. SIO3I5]|uniref:methylthioribulose 1-phosphate dehydratase n=1 Tax=Okeania sp. SIO3I5 TaxID=2607805 RepID=UPI0013BD34AE|nr:methylthioribulose 1-phosphate dehydratase [Okeania sp. SIO3I5]NEQ41637.1 methylthioribulose 1-phosphate dehydratase [Okeania sp. SIO3I5]
MNQSSNSPVTQQKQWDYGDTDELVCELCRHFYSLGWASGTGGGISIRDEDGIHVAPSGVQKERISPEDVFLLDARVLDRAEVLRPAANSNLRMSECTPLFMAAYRLRNAGAVLHSHSIWAMLTAHLCSHNGEPGVFRSCNLEMQKGLRGRGCFETVEVPIIPNTPRESQLTDSLTVAIEANPDVDAVIVAGHGVYVWGKDWGHAKTQAECYDYLFRAVVEAHRLGLPIHLENP